MFCIFQVIVMTLFMGMMVFAKVSIATVLRLENHNALQWYGIITQVGSALGAVLMFVLINVMGLFHAKYPCT